MVDVLDGIKRTSQIYAECDKSGRYKRRPTSIRDRTRRTWVGDRTDNDVIKIKPLDHLLSSPLSKLTDADDKTGL